MGGKIPHQLQKRTDVSIELVWLSEAAQASHTNGIDTRKETN